jgi:hypothetical protein
MRNEITDRLWDATHQALCAQQWSTARRLLDDLVLCDDNPDTLRSAREYGCPGELHGVIQDRIALVNTKALARWGLAG